MDSKLALEKLESLCARAERCTWELRQKLWNWKIPSTEADRILESLKKRKFVDDERFVRAFVNDKIKFARWGERKITAALVAKRIPLELIKTALLKCDEELIRRNLLDLLQAKSRTIADVASYEGRTKLFRYGISRGYYPNLVSQVIKENFK